MMSAIIIGIGLLGYFKYAGFFAEIINSMGVMVPVPEITLPIGISFYTFQGLSYVIDVYRNDARVQRNPFKIALYIALFPQLVAGPIVRYTTVETEISERRESIEEVSAGIVRFLFGLAKKMILANGMGKLRTPLFLRAPAIFRWLSPGLEPWRIPVRFISIFPLIPIWPSVWEKSSDFISWKTSIIHIFLNL